MVVALAGACLFFIMTCDCSHHLHSWITQPALPEDRSCCFATSVARGTDQGVLYVAGGRCAKGTTHRNVWQSAWGTFNDGGSRSDLYVSWADSGNLPMELSSAGLCSVGDHLFLAGGYTGSKTSSECWLGDLKA